MTPEEYRFFSTMKRAERERLDRYYSDPEFRKRFMLRCASGGAMRGHTKPPKVSLPKLSFMKDEK